MSSPEVSTESSATVEYLRLTFAFLLPFLVGFGVTTSAGMNISVGNTFNNFPLIGTFVTMVGANILLLPTIIFKTEKEKNDPNYQNFAVKMKNTYVKVTKNKNNGCTNEIIIFFGGLAATVNISATIFISRVVVGGVITSSVVDYYGYIWNDKQNVSLLNIFGALLSIVGLIIFEMNSLIKQNTSTVGGVLLLVSLFIGFFTVFEMSLAKRLGFHLKSAYHSSFWHYFVGIICTVICGVIVSLITNKLPKKTDNINIKNSFMWFGGAIDIINVVSSIIIPKYIGFTSFFLLKLIGQLTAAMIFDHFKIFTNARVKISLFRIFGSLIVLISAFIANYNRQLKKSFSVRSNSISSIPQVTTLNKTEPQVETVPLSTKFNEN